MNPACGLSAPIALLLLPPGGCGPCLVSRRPLQGGNGVRWSDPPPPVASRCASCLPCALPCPFPVGDSTRAALSVVARFRAGAGPLLRLTWLAAGLRRYNASPRKRLETARLVRDDSGLLGPGGCRGSEPLITDRGNRVQRVSIFLRQAARARRWEWLEPPCGLQRKTKRAGQTRNGSCAVLDQARLPPASLSPCAPVPCRGPALEWQVVQAARLA